MSEAPPSPAPLQRPGQPAGHWTILWLAAGLFALPWSYRLPWDTNRVAVLIFLPALWSGRRALVRSAEDFFRAQRAIAIAALVLALSIAFATSRSTHLADSIVMAASWVLTAAVALLARGLVRETPRATAWFAGAMALSGAVATALHWFRWRTGGDIQTAFYVYYRLMGLHALSSAFGALVMVYRTRTAPLTIRLAWVAVGIVAWGGLLWTGSRSPLLGLAAGCAVWFVTFRGPGRARWLASLAVLALSGLAVSYAFFSPARGIGWWHVWERSVPTQDAKALTSNRSDFWAGAVEHVRASPWFGYGPDAYGFLTPPLEGAQPHNVILQALLDVGAVGALALAAIAALVLWRAWRETVEPGAVPREWLGLAIACLVSGQLDGYFFYPLALLPAVIAFGSCAAAVAPRAGDDAARAWRLGVPFAAIAAAAVLGLHGWLFQRVAHGPVPSAPDALVVRTWRAFPSVTYNVDLWVDAWEKKFPDDALAISRIMSRNAQAPALLHVRTALILARRGAHREAVAELERAQAAATPDDRPAIEKLLASARTAAR